ncbi:MAG: glycine cleavage system protein GcvH [Acidobacteriota bacterium]
MVPESYRYTEEHEWLRVGDDGTISLGVTAFAQNELGEVVYVELPSVGDAVTAGDPIGSIESVKAVAEIYSPIGGEIAAVNSSLDDAPEQVNDAPHDDGWLVRIKPDDDAQSVLDGLMDATAYRRHIAGADDA